MQATDRALSYPTLPRRPATDRRTAICALVLTACLMLLALPAAAQVGGCVPGLDLGIGPALLDNTNGERRLGAEVFVSGCSSGHDLRRVDGERVDRVAFTPPRPFPYSWTLGLDGRFSVIPDGGLVPMENRITGRAGISVSLSKPAEPVDCEELTDDECARAAARIGATEFDYGFVALSARTGYASSLGFSEQSLVGGLELRYGHLRGYIPSVVLSYEAVKPVASDVRQAEGVDDELYGRGTVEAYLYHRAGRLMGEVQAALYRTSGLASALEALGWDDGAYVMGTLSVLPAWTVFDVTTVARIYVRYTDGRMPSLTAGGESLGIGIELEL